MVKNILLVVMTILALMCFAFGFVQKLEADKQQALSVVMMKETEQAKSEEIKAKDIAARAQAEAEMQRAIVVECLNGKKK